MNFSRLWHLLTTSRYTRSLEKRIEALEAAMLSMASPQPVPQGDPAAVDLGVGTGTVSTPSLSRSNGLGVWKRSN
jgi:hypothetical protein